VFPFWLQGARVALNSFLFSGDAALEACARDNAAHIFRGARGVHVGKIQAALVSLDDATIDIGEWESEFYGPSTEAAVLAYKSKRSIINRDYQTQPDAIVGIMTIASLDQEMVQAEDDSHGAATRCSYGLGAFPFGNPTFLARASSFVRAQQFRDASVTAGQQIGSLSLAPLSIRDAEPSLPNFPKPSQPGPPVSAATIEIDTNVGGGERADLAFINYQMVPVGETRPIVILSQGQDTKLLLPDNIETRIDGRVLGAGAVVLKGRRDGYLLSVKGVRVGGGIMRVKLIQERADTLFRFALISAKSRRDVTFDILRIKDARGRESKYTLNDLTRSFSFTQQFFKKWCNINMVLNSASEMTVDEDLGDEFEFSERITNNDVRGRKERTFQNDFDEKTKSNRDRKIIYVMRKLRDPKNPTLLGVTVALRRIFLQDFADDPTLVKVMAHECGHSFGATHTSAANFLMAELVELMGNLMHGVDIDACNSTGIDYFK
jgi:hypothetical protein